MFPRELAINEFQLEYFTKVVSDLSEATLFQPADGHGHTPAWVLGHLAICAELGQQMLGGSLTHLDWKERFGPRSVDTVTKDDTLSLELLAAAVVDGYRDLRQLARTTTDESLLTRPHGSPSLTGTPIVSTADMIALLLTNHFAFHLSQLSSCRRSAGYDPLF
ncbi:DinB family protein [Crateriforma conspicua]|uniref:DinB family protein n=2 Tax=Crateriforma TaxID=2714592 RepID=UPI0011B4FD4B